MANKFRRIEQDNPYVPTGALVGVFVKSLGGDDGHTGFLFYYEQKENGVVVESGTRRLDFVTNEKIIFRALDQQDKATLAHAPMQLNKADDTILAAYLTAVIETNTQRPPILYGMKWDGQRGCFDASGKYVAAEKLDGLSCATFVDALIAKALRNPAADFKSWEETQIDLDWRTRKLDVYEQRIKEKRTKITAEQIAAMAAIEPLKRIRPEQIAGAATETSSSWPIIFSRAEELAKQVVSDFASCFAPPPPPTPTPTPTPSV